MVGREGRQQQHVERLAEASVGDGHVDAALGQQVGGAQSLADAGAVADQRDTLALAQDLAGADPDQLGPRDLDADAGPTRVADRGRAVD